MIGKFEILFAIAERLIKARPMLSTLAGGIPCMIGFGLLLILFGFHLRMTSGWFVAFVILLDCSAHFLWSLFTDSCSLL